ncbi:MAG: hypothetical protein EOS57_32175 [Mesorhizobium sp.]|nr:MAG: hypothetical protein EOS57_32175 [Mesorhizobium sp.]
MATKVFSIIVLVLSVLLLQGCAHRECSQSEWLVIETVNKEQFHFVIRSKFMPVSGSLQP